MHFTNVYRPGEITDVLGLHISRYVESQCTLEGGSEVAEEDQMYNRFWASTTQLTGVIRQDLPTSQVGFALNPFMDQEPGKELHPGWGTAAPEMIHR